MYYKISARPTHASYFTEHNVVAIGWQGLNFSQMSDADVGNGIRKKLLGSTGSRIGRAVAQALRFQHMEAGAKLLIPVPYGVLLAHVAGDQRIYSASAVTLDIPNQRGVSFMCEETTNEVTTVARRSLSEGLSRRLNVRGTYCQDLSEFSKEIDLLFAGESVATQDEAQEVEAARAFSETLLSRLSDGSSLLASGGRGLEELVRDIFIADGYSAQILSKRAYSGGADADIQANKEDVLGSMLVYIQVKHHVGISGAHGMTQIKELINSGQVGDATHFVLLTTGVIPDSVVAEAATSEETIVLIDGPAFVERLIAVLPKLDSSWWKVLRISEVPRLLG